MVDHRSQLGLFAAQGLADRHDFTVGVAPFANCAAQRFQSEECASQQLCDAVMQVARECIAYIGNGNRLCKHSHFLTVERQPDFARQRGGHGQIIDTGV